MTLRSHEPTGPLEKRWEKDRFEMKLVNPANKRKLTVIVVGTGLAGASAAATLITLASGAGAGRDTRGSGASSCGFVAGRAAMAGLRAVVR